MHPFIETEKYACALTPRNVQPCVHVGPCICTTYILACVYVISNYIQIHLCIDTHTHTVATSHSRRRRQRSKRRQVGMCCSVLQCVAVCVAVRVAVCVAVCDADEGSAQKGGTRR